MLVTLRGSSRSNEKSFSNLGRWFDVPARTFIPTSGLLIITSITVESFFGFEYDLDGLSLVFLGDEN